MNRMEVKTLVKYWENPKQFLPLLLYLGVILTVAGSGLEWVTANSAIATDGWIVVGTSVFLWVLKEFGKKSRP
jgi:hypothetical protein